MYSLLDFEKETLMPFCLITSQNDEETNIMANSWWTIVSHKPATIAVSIGKRSFTNSLIKKNLEFGLNIVGKDFKENALKCGTVSGRQIQKVKEFGIELDSCKVIKTKLVKDSIFSFACKVIQTIELEDHSLFIGEILEIIGNPKNGTPLFAIKGYKDLMVPLMN